MVANGAYTRTESFNPALNSNSRLTGLFPHFAMDTKPDPLATEREGRPIFRDIEIVELISPGNPLNIPVEIVTDEHRQQWPEQYRAFRAGHEISADGTPLEQWPILRKAQVAELKALNIMTVEHVRDMSDHACQRGMGFIRLRALAKAYLEDAAEGALLSQVTADGERKDARIAELEHKVDELSGLLNSVHSEMQTMKNAPHPLATYIPGMHDPVEQAKVAGPMGGASSLDALPEFRRRGGRPPLPRDAQGNIIRE
jgi:hypothetical protein